MNIERAQQIMQSKDKVNVELDGVPVWIESIDDAAHTVTVHEERQPDTQLVVPINQLKEQ